VDGTAYVLRETAHEGTKRQQGGDAMTTAQNPGRTGIAIGKEKDMAISIGHPRERRMPLGGLGAAVALVALIGAGAGLAAVAMDDSGSTSPQPFELVRGTVRTFETAAAGPEQVTLVVVADEQQKAEFLQGLNAAQAINDGAGESLPAGKFEVLVVAPDASATDWRAVEDLLQIRHEMGTEATLIDLR
jgi:hypothetical protein